MTVAITTYTLSGENERLGFSIRDESRITRTKQPHRHDFFQMRLDVVGETHHAIGAQRRLLGPGSLTFVLPYRLHRGGRRADSQFYVINFHHRFLRPELNIDPLCLDVLALEQAPELAPFAFQDVLDFRLDHEDFERAQDACRQMIAHSRRRGFFFAEFIRANLLLLIGLACQRYERDLTRLSASGAHRSGHNEALATVVRHVTARLPDRIRLADVADELGTSPNHVTRLLKQRIGKTFMQLLAERRLQRAQELLANTDMRIADVGEAVGFEDNAYFARRFKQLLGMSPRAYRASAAQAGLKYPK
ncbi:MAG: helix-turn-helix domain-containing protein [Betaproteobacteria bacterium]|nr:helix-turn-helix domain-containing protein [Betaproteobacteria bacterium]